MGENNKDILNLCRLNLMEENAGKSFLFDKDATLRAIAWKKKKLIENIVNNPPSVEDGVMERHIKENTIDGVYPWTDAESCNVEGIDIKKKGE